MSLKTRPLILGVCAFAAFVAFTNYLFGEIGQADGAKSLARLQQVWPQVLDMPEADRALLGTLAMTCHVEDRPAVVSETIACLREAVASDHPMLPKGVDRTTAAHRLDQLLEERP